MSKSLTLSVIIPEDQIRKSLALSLLDIDSHLSSLRYSSLEFVILGNNNLEGISELFSPLVPSIIETSLDNLKESISGENIIVINTEKVERDTLDTVTDFVKKDTPVAVISSKDGLSILDKITNFLIKILKFKKPLRSNAFPHVVYMKRETFNDFHHLRHHELVTFFDFNDHDVEVIEHEGFKSPGFFHYIKVWFYLISLKIKELIKIIKRKILPN